MTVTNDERREVAARLRDFENLRPTFKDSVICGFLEALDIDYLDWEGVCNRLADLIEPEQERTCRITRESVDIDGTCMTDYSCGCFNNEGWNHNYCPNCGARVIDKEN